MSRARLKTLTLHCTGFGVDGSNTAYIYKDGETTAVADPNDGTAYAHGHNLDGDESANIRIRYEAVTRLVYVYYDSADTEPSTTELMVAKLDLSDFAINGKALFGFTGEEGTWNGGSTFLISNVKIATGVATTANTMVEEQGLTKRLREGTITLASRTSCETPLRTGGNFVGSEVVLVHKKQKLQYAVTGTDFTDLGDGRYSFNYVGCDPDQLGWFEYCSTYEGKYWVFLDGANIGSVSLIEDDE